jgi:type IV secretion system protein VirB9
MKKQWTPLALSLLLLAAPAVHATDPPSSPAPGAPAVVPDHASPPPAPSDIPEDVAQATRAYAAGASLGVLEHTNAVRYPYGHSVPTLQCAPLRVCAIELEDGEVVLDSVTGDSERWIVGRALAGGRGQTPLLVVKPTACDLTTNLVVTTDRRIYQVVLNSRACKDSEDSSNPRVAYTPLLAFYYPDDLVHTWASAQELARKEALRDRESRTPLAGAVPLGALNFAYRLSPSGRFPWLPEVVFDDGVHTYIRIPQDRHIAETPVLFVLKDGRATDLLNFAVRPPYYIADRVLDRAALVIGSGRDQRRLEITNLAHSGGR